MPTIRATYLKPCWSSYHQYLNSQKNCHNCRSWLQRDTIFSGTEEEDNVAFKQYCQTPCLNSDGRGSRTLCSNLHSHLSKTTSFIRYGKHWRKTKSVSYISNKVYCQKRYNSVKIRATISHIEDAHKPAQVYRNLQVTLEIQPWFNILTIVVAAITIPFI